MYSIYSCYGWGKTQIGEYELGTVFSGRGWGRTQVGEYENGDIYIREGWSRTKVGEYDGDAGGGAAALLLLSELSANAESSSSQYTPPTQSSDSTLGCLIPLIKIFGPILAVIAIFYTSYAAYFLVPWTVTSYALFFSCIISAVIANVYVNLLYKDAVYAGEMCKNLIAKGLGVFAVSCCVLSFTIYLIEIFEYSTSDVWTLLGGLVIAPINISTFALPFVFLELLILVIVRSNMKKAVEEKLRKEERKKNVRMAAELNKKAEQEEQSRKEYQDSLDIKRYEIYPNSPVTAEIVSIITDCSAMPYEIALQTDRVEIYYENSSRSYIYRAHELPDMSIDEAKVFAEVLNQKLEERYTVTDTALGAKLNLKITRTF